MITKRDLLNWLKEVDGKLGRDMIVVAVGGTAMTLLDLKESTRDVDFCVESKDVAEFKKITQSKLFVVDIFQNGFIFALQLPENYIEKAIDQVGRFTYLKLKVLGLEDIVLTKTSRLNARDIDDIKSLAKTGKINVNYLKERFEEIVETFAGREEDFRYHFDLVLKMFFRGA